MAHLGYPHDPQVHVILSRPSVRCHQPNERRSVINDEKEVVISRGKSVRQSPLVGVLDAPARWPRRRWRAAVGWLAILLRNEAARSIQELDGDRFVGLD